MKKVWHNIQKNKYFILIMFFSLLGLYGVVHSIFLCSNKLAAWYSSVVTVVSILFVYLGLKENQKSHEANLNVYVNLKFPACLNSIGNEREVLNLQGFILNITPVNDGLI